MRSRSSKPCSSCGHGTRRVWAGWNTPRSLRRFQPVQVPRVSLNPYFPGYPWRPFGIIPIDRTIMLPMRNVMLFSCLLAGLMTCDTFAQAPATPAQQKPATAPAPAPAPTTQKPAAPAPATQTPPPATQTPPPATQKPAQTTPAPRRAPVASARSGMAITVTSPQGSTISGVQVALMGPTERGGETDGSGQVNFPGLQAGTYRLRFSGDKVTAFEKEVAVVAGRIADVDVTLNPAPEPKVIEKTVTA